MMLTYVVAALRFTAFVNLTRHKNMLCCRSYQQYQAGIISIIDLNLIGFLLLLDKVHFTLFCKIFHNMK